jgi:hypothetical protein
MCGKNERALGAQSGHSDQDGRKERHKHEIASGLIVYEVTDARKGLAGDGAAPIQERLYACEGPQLAAPHRLHFGCVVDAFSEGVERPTG